ncbi:MAG: transglutaminase domain-containing protein, partial [Armatimonadota bacterium]
MDADSAAQTTPHATDVSTTQWLAGYLAAWLVMLAAILALDAISADRPFVLLTMAIWLAALPVSFLLRGLRVPRAAVNIPVVMICFILAVPLIAGRLGLRIASLDMSQLIYGVSDAGAVEFLIRMFIWIMVFRAFTVRTFRDLTLCAVPSISALVLTSILHPDMGMLIFFCGILLGGTYLLAADHRMAASVGSDFVAGAGDRRPDAGTVPRSAWIWVYVGTLLCGAVLCLALTRVTVTTDVTRSLKFQAARRLARFIVQRTHVPYGGVAGGIYLRRPAPQLSDAVMFTVKSPREANWRVTAYDAYGGYVWEQSGRQTTPLARRGKRVHQVLPPPQQQTAAVADREGDRPLTDPWHTHGVEVEQTVTLRNPFQGAIVGAYRPVLYVGPGRSVRHDPYGGLSTNSMLHRGTRYVVTSLIPSPRSVPPSVAAGPYPPAIADGPYLDLGETPTSVVGLAQDVTRDADSPYAKALRIEAYLGETCTYDPNTGATPRQSDVVEYFLLKSQRGYCIHFATAMAVMCRAVGIPARLAVGYSSGEYDVETDEYVVRERHTHAWPEVYLNSIGWVAFDPTRVAADTQLTGMALVYEGVAERWQGIVQRLPLPGAGPLRRLLLFLLIAGAALAGGARVICRRLAPVPVGAHVSLLADEPSRRLVRAYWAVCNGAARRGLARRRSQTAFEFADVLSAAVPRTRYPVWWLTQAYADLVFGERPPDERAADLADARARRTLALLRKAPPIPPPTPA